jgi:hypothetical protein
MSPDNQKIFNSFSKALELIDQVRNAKDAEPSRERDLLVWRSAAETEYLAFLIANLHGLEDFVPDSEKGGAISADAARDLIEKGRGLVELKPRLAYANVRQAVSILRGMSADERRARRVQSSQPENR